MVFAGNLLETIDEEAVGRGGRRDSERQNGCEPCTQRAREDGDDSHANRTTGTAGLRARRHPALTIGTGGHDSDCRVVYAGLHCGEARGVSRGGSSWKSDV